MNRILDAKGCFAFAIVFSAVALSVYLLVSTLYKVSLERLENRQGENDDLKYFVTLPRLLSMRFSGAFILGTAVVVILLSCGVLNPFIYLPAGVAAAVLGWMAPLLYFRWKVTQRKELFEAKLLDFTMGLASGMRSGLGLPQALEATAKRVGDPMQEELQTVLREYRFGMELPEALQRLNNRMPSEDLSLLVTTIKLTTKTGGSLVEVMDKMVEMIRGRREFQERLKNMTAQGKFEAIAMSLAPLAAFILLYVIDPDLMRPMVTTGMGWCGIGLVAVMITCGYLVIKKIVTIEV
ncbi:MAG: type II secretion system F family protein [Victivallales bacterium]|nr:type II secretion system F family protein [Victivallales bacterium]